MYMFICTCGLSSQCQILKLRLDRDVCVCIWSKVTFFAFFFFFLNQRVMHCSLAMNSVFRLKNSAKQ